MKKMIFILVAVGFISFVCSAGAYAAQMNKSVVKDSKNVSSWIGKDVRNTGGEKLGRVSGFVRGEGEKVSLVIISHGEFLGMGGKQVPVPFNALSFNESQDHAVLDVTKDQFAQAPPIGKNEDISNPSYAEEVRGYFAYPRYSPHIGAKTHGQLGSEDRFDTNRGAVEDLQSETLPWGDY